MVLLEDREILAQLPGLLLPWYDGGARVLPWREEPTPYRVWVSEIMLQQTRVEAVRPYYERFLEAFPTVEALAAAPEEKLLKMWEGLGYYNRARNLQRAAQQVVELYDGEVPASYEALRALPGVGDYTAGAIASIAFQLPVPAVDGNVLRVIARVLCRYDNILDAKVKRRTEEELRQALPQRVGDFNQSLMELGALVCLPGGAPRCLGCPLHPVCRAGRPHGKPGAGLPPGAGHLPWGAFPRAPGKACLFPRGVAHGQLPGPRGGGVPRLYLGRLEGPAGAVPPALCL